MRFRVHTAELPVAADGRQAPAARRSVLIVAHTERNDTIRIISARRATKRERAFYEQAKPTGR